MREVVMRIFLLILATLMIAACSEQSSSEKTDQDETVNPVKAYTERTQEAIKSKDKLKQDVEKMMQERNNQINDQLKKVEKRDL